MCILISTTEHPEYPLVLLSNRDEYFRRPTALATFRPSNKENVKILSPLDLARPEHGTWIGITTEGKLAVLLNYSENNILSRGIVPIKYLESEDESDAAWLDHLKDILAHNKPKSVELQQIGGFSLLYGQLKLVDGKIQPLHVMSNRGDKGNVHVFGDGNSIEYQTTFGLSNSLYYDPWPKVKTGEKLLSQAVKKSIENHENQDIFVESCIKVLSTNSFDMKIAEDPNVGIAAKQSELKKSIFIPPVHTGLGGSVSPVLGEYYGTRTQTVILLHKTGKVTYYEKTLHNADEEKLENRVKKFEFEINQ